MDKFHSNKQGPAFKGTVQSANFTVSGLCCYQGWSYFILCGLLIYGPIC